MNVIGWAKAVGSRGRIIRELLKFLWDNKLWWMVPMVLVLFILGTMVFLASQTPVGPFIYTLF